MSARRLDSGPLHDAHERRHRPPDLEPEEGRLPAEGRIWRLTLTGAVACALVYGTVAGTDDLFPLGPMVQYAFSVPPDGEIRSLSLEADTATGTRITIPLEPYYVGVRRAEVEGQLGRYRRDPSLLGRLAQTYRRLRPGDPRLVGLHLVTLAVRLKDRRPAATRRIDEVSWPAH